MIHKLPKTLTFLALLALLSTCGNPTATKNYERAHTPWAVRSVLDLKPRMLSLALNENLWVAYSTQFGSLYKAWKGDVNFNGTVWNTKHGPQPNTEGIDYFENKYESPWVVEKNGTAQDAKFTYVSYAFTRGQVTLTYELALSDSEVITIQETPEYIENEEGIPGFERVFQTKNVPAGVSVSLQTNAAKMRSSDDFQTDGVWTVQAEEEIKTSNGEATQSLDGKLTLKANAKTTLKVYFDPSAMDEQQVVETAGISPEEMIAQSDCHACHNEEKKSLSPLR